MFSRIKPALAFVAGGFLSSGAFLYFYYNRNIKIVNCDNPDRGFARAILARRAILNQLFHCLHRHPMREQFLTGEMMADRL
jgi:hypothetical protein